ncbi:MAG: GNAT family N-acetyltransferase [Candidatus Magasanikbacteria bacterium]
MSNFREGAGGEPLVDPMALESLSNKEVVGLKWPVEAISSVIPKHYQDKNSYGFLSPENKHGNELLLCVYRKGKTAKGAEADFYFGEETIDEELLKQLKGKGRPEFFVHLGKMNNEPQTLVLHSIDLAQASRGQGIGAEFNQRLLIIAKQLGFNKIVVSVVNESAKNLYKSLGFTSATGETLRNMKIQGIYTRDPNKKEYPMVRII